MVDLIKVAEEAFAAQQERPSFKAGDTVTVAYKIVEGNKERIQLYRGVVIKIKGHGDKKRFTVRKMSGTVGVERIFPMDSPSIDRIEVNKIGKVRRAKLYYAQQRRYKPRHPQGFLPWLNFCCYSPKTAGHHLTFARAEVLPEVKNLLPAQIF